MHADNPVSTNPAVGRILCPRVKHPPQASPQTLAPAIVAVVRKILSSNSQFWLGMPIATIPITAATTIEAMKTRRNSLVKR